VGASNNPYLRTHNLLTFTSPIDDEFFDTVIPRIVEAGGNPPVDKCMHGGRVFKSFLTNADAIAWRDALGSHRCNAPLKCYAYRLVIFHSLELLQEVSRRWQYRCTIGAPTWTFTIAGQRPLENSTAMPSTVSFPRSV
jgi:hypothetical protein